MNETSMLPSLQSGFINNHSTFTVLANILSDMKEVKDKGRLISPVGLLVSLKLCILLIILEVQIKLLK